MKVPQCQKKDRKMTAFFFFWVLPKDILVDLVMKDVTWTEPTQFWMWAFCNPCAGSRDAFCLLFLRGESSRCWLCVLSSGHGAELRQERCSSSAKHREPELPEHSSPEELPALNICNSKYEIFVSHPFFSQHVKKEALLIDFSAIFLWHMPWHCSTDAITSSMVQKYSFSKLCDCSQEARTSHNYSKRSVEENYTLMLYLEEVSLRSSTFISTCSNLLQQFLSVWLPLDIVLVNCCAGLCTDGTASPSLVLQHSLPTGQVPEVLPAFSLFHVCTHMHCRTPCSFSVVCILCAVAVRVGHLKAFLTAAYERMKHEDNNRICNNKSVRSNPVHNIQIKSKNFCSDIQK